VRSAIELWGIGRSIEECVSQVGRWTTMGGFGKKCYEEHADKSKSWKITIHTLGTKYTREEQDAMRMQFAFLDLKGDVKMKDPSNEFVMVREVELDTNGSPRFPRYSLGKQIIPENDALASVGSLFRSCAGWGAQG